MNDDSVPNSLRMEDIVARLQQAPRLQRIAVTEPGANATDLATEAALGLLDIQRSCASLSRLVETLSTNEPASEAFDDVLNDIGEEYRHIYYHLTHTRLFNYIVHAP